MGDGSERIATTGSNSTAQPVKSRASLLGVVLVVLVLAFSSIMSLIADLDRPQEGLLKVSQQAMIDLRRMMNDIR